MKWHWPWQWPEAAPALEEMAGNTAEDADDCDHQALIDQLQRENDLLHQDLAAAECTHCPDVATDYTGRIRDIDAQVCALQAEIRALGARPKRTSSRLDVTL